MFFIGDEKETLISNINDNDDTALIIVDMQNDFCDPNGALYIKGADLLYSKILSLLSNYNTIIFTQDYHPDNHCSFYDNIDKTPLSNKTLLLYPNQNMTQIRNKVPLFGKVILENEKTQILWPRHCVQNTWGSQLIKQLKPTKNDFVVFKGNNENIDSYSAFFDNGKVSKTPLDNYLKSRNIKKVNVVGLAFDYCVGYTAIDAKLLGYETRIILKATKSVSEISSNIMKQKLIASGVKLI